MKLVIKRNKKSGLCGKSKYELYVRAEISEEEKTLVVYHSKTGLGAFADFSFWSALWRMFFDTQMTVDTFVRGTTFKCKDVMELIRIEDEAHGASLMPAQSAGAGERDGEPRCCEQRPFDIWCWYWLPASPAPTSYPHKVFRAGCPA